MVGKSYFPHKTHSFWNSLPPSLCYSEAPSLFPYFASYSGYLILVVPKISNWKKKLKKNFFSHFFFLEVISTINTRFSSIGTILIRKPEVRQNGTFVNFRNSPKQLCRACGAYRAAIFIDSSKVIKGEILSIVYRSFHVITTFWYDLRFGSYRPGKSSGYLILVVPKISIYFF